MSTIHVRPGEGRHYPMIDGDHVAKAAVRDACGAFEVFETIAPAAPMSPPHVSPWTTVLFLLEGRITALVDGTSYDVEPGGLVVAPAGTPTPSQSSASPPGSWRSPPATAPGGSSPTSPAPFRRTSRSKTRWRRSSR